MLLHPGVEFKPVEGEPVEGDALGANGNFGDMGADFGVEAVAVHAQVARGVAEADEPREQHEPRERHWLVPGRRAHRASPVRCARYGRSVAKGTSPRGCPRIISWRASSSMRTSRPT